MNTYDKAIRITPQCNLEDLQQMLKALGHSFIKVKNTCKWEPKVFKENEDWILSISCKGEEE